MSRKLTVTVKPVGPDASFIETLQNALGRNKGVAAMAEGGFRLLKLDFIDEEDDAKRRPAAVPKRFRAMVYDEANQQTLLVEGDVDKPHKATVTPSGRQPRPTAEEFREAAAVVAGEGGDALRTYRPMPPLIPTESPDGAVERTVSVGVRGAGRHEIVGVNLNRREVIRFEGGAPPNALASDQNCGHPNAGQETIKDTPGQVWVTVKQGFTTLWKFLVVRPAISSGTNGSGVELRYVDYRGKRVLFRAHVPILNVKYGTGPCGPYRDWQDEESAIQADGKDVGSGFRLASSPATTIIDTGNDHGNFTGVAIYVQGLEVVLVSEMEAGWYRYISEWRLHANGTIKPRFGFSAVEDSCVCNVHYHHVYWRFDFDLRTAGSNSVLEFNDPPAMGSRNWHETKFEVKRFRERNRKWRVVNTKTKEAYDIVPGAHDGAAQTTPDWPFGRGDVWILRYRSSEIDDGSVATGPPYEAGLDAWVNGESVQNTDVVVWYGGHFAHDLDDHSGSGFGEILGPDLVRVKW